MSHQPLISVVIGTYNREATIVETLESVFAQTYPHYEVIVVDDASTDGTVEVVRSYGDRIRLVRREVNSGTADIPRYEAVRSAKGLLCAFLDSDDRWHRDKLARQTAFMTEHPECPLSHTYVRIIDEHGLGDVVRHEGAIPPTGRIAERLLHHCFICTSSVMVRPDVWLAAQREEQLTAFGTEWDFFLVIAREHPVGFLPEVLADYRRSPAGVSQQWRRLPRDVASMERIYHKHLWEGIVPRRAMREILADACLEDARHHRYEGHPARSFYFLRQAAKYGPLRQALWAETARAAGRCVLRKTAAG